MPRITNLDDNFNVIRAEQDVDSYKALLKSLQDSVVVLEQKKNLDQVHVFTIDWNTRIITPPPEFQDYLGVTGEHKAETLTFRCARYYDEVDLAKATIVVEYVNADGEGRVSPIIAKDFTTFTDEIIFDWTIDIGLLKKAGDVKFAVRFFRIGDPVYTKFYDDEEHLQYISADNYHLVYSLRTIPFETKVVETLPLKEDVFEKQYSDAVATELDVFIGQVQALMQEIEEKELLWYDIT